MRHDRLLGAFCSARRSGRGLLLVVGLRAALRFHRAKSAALMSPVM
jgi:hypothetical protein